MKDEQAAQRAHDVFDPICDELFARPGVDLGPMFGSEGIRVRGKVFAFISHSGVLVVKLPADRVDALECDGIGTRMTMSGRTMREWFSIDADAADRWRDLVHEALAYVDSITP